MSDAMITRRGGTVGTGGVGGIAPSNMRSFSVESGDACVKIRMQEPEDTVIDNQLLCTWKGTKVVMKTGSYPAHERDGETVLDCTVRGQYNTTPFEVTGLTNDTTYYFQAFPYSDYGMYNRNEYNRTTCTPQEYQLYGFRIAKNDSNPATRITYTEMAVGKAPASVNLTTGVFDYGDWEDAWFIADNKPYMVKYDGTIDYELCATDYTKKVDGVTASDVSNTSYDGNAMAKIPLVWLKQWEDADYQYCNICNIQFNNDYEAYAHMRADGSVQEYIMLSCFEGALSSGKMRSIKGLTPMNTKTAQEEITAATANGALWYTRSWAHRNLINMLLTLISRNDNGQTSFGYGYCTGGSSTNPNYLPTGYRSDKGQFYGTNADRDTVKIFHIENWWGDVWERIAGMVYTTGAKLKVKMYPPYNLDGTGYTETLAVFSGTSGGYIKTSQMNEYGRLPLDVSGSETTYQCDVHWWNAADATKYALVGGACAYGSLSGPWASSVLDPVSLAFWAIGCALSCEQPVAA